MPPRRPSRRNSMVAKALLGLLPLAPPVIHSVIQRGFQPGPVARKTALVETEAPPSTEISRADAVPAQCDDVLDFQDCHSRFPTGCSQAAGYDADLNFLKNLLIPAPAAGTPIQFLSQQDFQNLDANLPDGLSKNNHANFADQLSQLGEGQMRGVTGFLYYAQPSGVESSNCQLANTDGLGSNVDFHIGIGFSPVSDLPGSDKKTLQQNSIIVEMTPHSRFNFKPNVWTLANVTNAVGKQVKVVGQLLVDSEHNVASQNCALASTAKQKQSCWRASVWELHPVVSFQVCNADSCAQDDSNWVELDQLSGGSSVGGGGNAPAAGFTGSGTTKRPKTPEKPTRSAKPQSGPGEQL